MSEQRSSHAHDHSGVALANVRPFLHVYYRSLAGQNPYLIPYGNDEDPSQFPDTHTTIRLPSFVDKFDREAENFSWYKVALTHRAAHYEGGTFDFSLQRPAVHFCRLLSGDFQDLTRYELETDLEYFFRIFAHRVLAIEIFTTLEDLRLDEQAKLRYPGLRDAFELVQRQALTERPVLDIERPRMALAEIMVRFSLNSAEELSLPELLHEPVRNVARTMARLREPGATVEDSAEGALRVYSLVTSIPNLKADYGALAPVDLEAEPRSIEWPTAWPEPERVRLEGDPVLETTVQPVSYRDLIGSRYTRYRAGTPVDQEAIFFFRESPEEGPETARASGYQDQTLMAQEAGRDEEEETKGPPEPVPHDHHHEEEDHHHAEGSLHSHEPGSFVYPEWDYIAGEYRPRWCLVREIPLEPSDTNKFYQETLQAYGSLVPEIRRQLEQFAPEGLRKVRRTQYGDELDLDASIEALVDIRVGISPSDHVYTSRERLRRDVAVAFLLDMSSSTAEYIEPSEVKDGQALQRRLTPPSSLQLHGKKHRSVIDIEKESIALLMAALERLGDTYGIYGFSSTGRDNVQFMVIKEMQERLSEQVSRRIENVRPVHTTRMGPAIRHATLKLRGQEEKTKLLMLVSDGRPFDLDYGQEYGEGAEIDYAINDTREALNEALQYGITPFLLTVDQDGFDYLRYMCDGLDYEVLSSTELLPARLLTTYRRLSA